MTCSSEASARPDAAIDLDGVHPMRRALVLTRVRAVQQWLALDRPDADQEARAAAELGLGVPMFRNLVRAWRDHGRAAGMPGAKAGSGERHRLTPSASKEAEGIVAEVISDIGASSRPIDVRREVEARCAARGVKAPRAGLVTARLYSARAGRTVDLVASELILDHCAVRLPVVFAGVVRAPVASICFDDAGRIFSWRLRVGGPNPQTTAETLAAALRTQSEQRTKTLVMAADRTPGWNDLLRCLAAAGVHRVGAKAAPVPSSRRIRAAFGAAIGGIALLPNMTHSERTPGFARWLSSDPIEMSEARGAFSDAVKLSNAQRGDADRRPRIARDRAERKLADTLFRLAEEETETPRRRR